MKAPHVLGCGINYSKQLKLHLLLDGEAFNFLWDWRTFDGVDEQNIESSHLQFNQMLRRFRNSCGGFCQKMMTTEFAFSHSTWTTNIIDEMLKASDRGKYKTKKAYQSGQRATNASQRRGASRGCGAPFQSNCR